MKRLSVIALAVFVAGCDTMGYPNDPYGPPPYPPGGAYPPMPPGPAPACSIAGSREWTASISTIPGSPTPTLYVSGKVLTATGGYKIEFEPYLQLAESYPAQAFATLRVTPPSQPTVQVVMTHNVRWQWPVHQPIGRVVVRCGDQTLAEIAPVQSTR